MLHYARMLLAGSRASTLDTQSVTVGVQGTVPNQLRGFLSGSFGSISDGTSNLYGGAAITEFYNDQTTLLSTFKITGIFANSGWTTMTVAPSGGSGSTLARSAATFTASGGFTSWAWPSFGMGTTGTVTVVTFT